MISDVIAQSVMKRIIANRWSNCPPDERTFKNVKETLSIHNDLLFCRDFLYVPPSMRNNYIEIAHQAHFGIQGTEKLLRNEV